MMFDRYIRATIDAKGGDYVFSCIDPTLKSADTVVANLEGPITSNASVSINSIPGDGNNFTFTFPTTTAELLAGHNIGLVNLGNNHIYNFGAAGVRSTITALNQVGVSFFGDPLDARVAESKSGDVPLAFINYNQFGGSASTTIVQIRDERARGRIPIVYTHWGVEYATTSDWSLQQKLAHAFVNAGAEMVIGSHPHVVEEEEVYSGKHIYYSLGNFIFDQYWEPAVRDGLLLDVVFDTSGVRSIKEIPVELERDGRTCAI